MTVAVYPASFDPIHCGHVDIAARAARVFEKLIVAVFAYPRKNVLFSLDERVAMVRESLASIERVEVASYGGLLVDFCREREARVVVRGLRAISDFEYEYQQAGLNRKMLPGLEYVSIFASIEYSFLSSSIVKEISEHGGDVEGLGLVPAPVGRRLRDRQPQVVAASRG